MVVAVVTDSASALPGALVAKMGIQVVPMRLTIGGDVYEEGQISLEEVIARFGEGVKTAGPSAGELVDVLRASDTGGGVIVLTVSERMSSTYKSALLAAELGPPSAVVDTGSAAGGQALVVLAAAQAASEGLDLRSVAERATAVRDRVRLVAAVATLDYLVEGGRIPEIAARAGRYLGVQPIFELKSDGIKALRPALSRERALEALLGHWRHSRPGQSGPLHVVVSHALDTEAAEHLVGAICAEVKPATCLVSSFGPVMVAHTGPGVVGLAWYWDEAAAEGG